MKEDSEKLSLLLSKIYVLKLKLPHNDYFDFISKNLKTNANPEHQKSLTIFSLDENIVSFFPFIVNIQYA